jgi:diacylglycerol kinase (ATP)
VSSTEPDAKESRLPVLGKQPKRVHAVINPGAGQDQPILKLLNAVFRKNGIDWDISITKSSGDGRRLAQQAARSGVDLLLVNGGDGTVMECASGLIGTSIPLVILPGGTANVMAHELGVPFDLKEAITLAVNPHAGVRPIDMAQIGDEHFLLRAGMGFEAAMVEGADRELKDRVGLLAYGISALQALADPPIARYRLYLDGTIQEAEGLACIVANSGHLGAGGLVLSPKIDISDGLLDVLVITRADLPSLVSLLASVVGGDPEPPVLEHWQVRKVRVESDPPQTVQIDGEILAKTPVTIQVMPKAVKVLVPPQKALSVREEKPT